MNQVNASQIRTHHVTLPSCASSFHDHAGCQGTIRTESCIIKCACEACHGQEAVPEAICPECHGSMPGKIQEYKVHDLAGTFTERSMPRYCAACREDFIREHLPALHAAQVAGAVRP